MPHTDRSGPLTHSISRGLGQCSSFLQRLVTSKAFRALEVTLEREGGMEGERERRRERGRETEGGKQRGGRVKEIYRE